jgi:sugar lactone lactonase YvrE
VLCDTINGAPLGIVNFVLVGPDNSLWFTVSSRKNEFMEGFRHDIADGYIGVFDGSEAKIVADNLSFPNEIRFDAKGDYIYVAETTGKRIQRMKVLGGNTLGEPKIFGPESLGDGFPDGIAFDAEGNLWVAMVVAEKIIVITPDQEVHIILDAGIPTAIADVEAHFSAGTLQREQMAAAKGSVAPLTSSIAFGGHDLKTVYLGCLAGNRIASFRSPIAGQPMAHWV